MDKAYPRFRFNEADHLKAIIYSVPKCPHTRRLKDFLKQKGVEIDEKCVLDSLQIMNEMVDVSGQRGLPVTVIGGDVFAGFDRLTERRMGRKLGGQ
jgi:glutaredoxin